MSSDLSGACIDKYAIRHCSCFLSLFLWPVCFIHCAWSTEFHHKMILEAGYLFVIFGFLTFYNVAASVPSEIILDNALISGCSKDKQCPNKVEKCDVPLIVDSDHCCGYCPSADVSHDSAKTRVTSSYISTLSRILKRQASTETSSAEPSASSTNSIIASTPVPSTQYPIPPIGTRRPTTQCPDSCEFEGEIHCAPVECHVPCVDGLKLPDNCCALCVNGNSFFIFLLLFFLQS